jgi:hypothetical protein
MTAPQDDHKTPMLCPGGGRGRCTLPVRRAFVRPTVGSSAGLLDVDAELAVADAARRPQGADRRSKHQRSQNPKLDSGSRVSSVLHALIGARCDRHVTATRH